MAGSSPPERILIVRPSALGDVCRTVPVLVSLRHAFPAARIDWLVRDGFADAIAAHPALDGVVPFPRSRFSGWWRSVTVAREALGWLRDLGRRRYDLVIDCQGLGRSGLFTRATRAARRVGFRGARELAWLGYNVRHPRHDGEHTVDAMLSLLRAEGIAPVPDLTLAVADDDRLWWAEERTRLGVGDQPYAVLAPTARWASKRWPIERWRALLEPLASRGMERCVVIGAPGESDQVRGIVPDDPAAAARAVDLVGRTDIGQTMAVIAGADLVIANDSAPLHIAVGLDRPCVALFGPTDPRTVGPYGRPEAVVPNPAVPDPGRVNYRDRRLGDALMRGIETEAVLQRVDAVLAAGRRGGREEEEVRA
jgi:lipopolysaccharide heptosyltransferase I